MEMAKKPQLALVFDSFWMFGISQAYFKNLLETEGFFVENQQSTRQQTTTNIYIRQQTFNQRVSFGEWCFFVAENNENAMTKKKAFDKDHRTKIPFLELVELINQKCDYKFSIIDDEVDEELIALGKKEGIDLTGYKHVIETSGTRHSESRHGNKSNDRTPLTIEDYLLIPYIIKFRDKVEISDKKTKLHGLKTFVYRKTIGDMYVYVEEIRIGKNKSLAFQTLYKRPKQKASP